MWHICFRLSGCGPFSAARSEAVRSVAETGQWIRGQAGTWDATPELTNTTRKVFAMKRAFKTVLTLRSLLVTMLAVVVMPAVGVAQPDVPKRGAVTLLEEVVVTARKRAGEEKAQSVPLSITAYNAEQIESLKVRNLESLAVAMPNVILDDIGTLKGVANFSIRGLGINSSIPSIDPTVGVFVDGVYLGINQGVIFDTFDIESIEVLRGPQGTLFGRNVTGGAVLINTKKPTDKFESSFRTATDGGNSGSGLNTYVMGTASGPLLDTLSAKMTMYYNNDTGWFENQFDGSDFGKLEQFMFRPTFIWNPLDDVEVFVKYEYGKISGDGPAAQSHTNGTGTGSLFPLPGVRQRDRDSFDFAIDERGFQKTRTDLVSVQMDWKVGATGTITNIFGWRNFSQDGVSDIDAQPANLFHAGFDTEAEQLSNELRYNGLHFQDKLNFTAGLYYFTNELNYAESRDLFTDLTALNRAVRSGGGDYEVETLAAFFSGDYNLTDRLVMTAGLRYTKELKEARITSITNAAGNQTNFAGNDVTLDGSDNRCNVVDGTCTPDFVDDAEWNSWSPKIGALYHVSDDARVYGHWSRGFRSGGYNLRNTDENNAPEGFDQEQTDSFEVGFKQEFARGRLNGAVFYNMISDMQREVNTSDPGAGVVQRVLNTADARIIGLEFDGVYALTDNLVFLGSLGWLAPEYTDVKEDLSGDGLVTDADEDLNLPRAPDVTWSVGLSWDVPVRDGVSMTARGNYAYRDRTAYTDDNLGFILAQNMLNAGLDFYTDNGWILSVYGNNLLETVRHGGDTQLPGALGGGTFSPLSKGRFLGVQLQYDFSI